MVRYSCLLSGVQLPCQSLVCHDLVLLFDKKNKIIADRPTIFGR
ncbi:hypothetical protein PP240_gp47 [Streptococcus phage P7574]|uniref:Uncharacterized protein n=1 Tax=Streptococcus phage P7574 TaxID=1971430 RepID=A0A286QQG6_9CAUD|nr:hypothetical protein PP240_gp47 [Streptococcus phage P7574]ARU13938.1 hypothetical protein P7574_47 [Streptococcus phage P7574]